ncbi:MAG: chloride channel protein [Candidatus Nitrosotenuis sp.]|nr:MAG: chloride channel protein [Candidatus Nitrosotenuis sp.]
MFRHTLKRITVGTLESLRRVFMQEHVFIVVVACVIGYFTGLCAVIFKWMIAGVHTVFLKEFFSRASAGSSLWLLLVPVSVGLGGLIVGLLNHYFNPSREGGGLAEPMKWAAIDQGRVPKHILWFRPIASAFTIGSGGSAGREAPTVQIGAAVGSLVSGFMKASSERRRLLMGCGTAGAIAASFNAPLGGIVFALEVVLGDFNIKVFSPLIFSSVIATVTARQLEGNVPAFDLPSYTLVSTVEIFFFLILGLLAGLVAALFYKTFLDIGDRFKNLKVHPVLLPAVGGVLAGLFGIFYPDALGNGYDGMNKVMNGQMLWHMALLLVFVKILLTGLTLGSNGSGGLYAPSLFIGCMVGGAFGALLNHLFPGSTGSAGSYALVGMGAVMSAVGHMPMTNILMTFELTNSYQIIVPIMVACISSTVTYAFFCKNSVDVEILRRKGINLWHGRESSIMGSLLVRDVMNTEFDTLREDACFRDILAIMAKSKAYYFPCVSAEGRMTGIISVQDIRQFMLDEELADVVVAKDMAAQKVLYLMPDDNLNDALEKFSLRDLDELPVVADPEKNIVVGMLRRKDVITAYKKAVIQATA